MKRRFVALCMALVLCLSLCLANTGAVVTASGETYGENYRISTILSQFQFFVKDDATELTSGAHTVGAIAVGGTLEMDNTFGDAAIVPSYVNHLEKGSFGNAWHGKYPTKNTTVYYGTSAVSGLDSNIWKQNSDYISMNKAFEQIIQQSQTLYNGAQQLTASDQGVVIDCTGDANVNVQISYSDFLKGVKLNVTNVDWFKTHSCVVSVTGVGSEAVTFDGYSKVCIGYSGISNQLKAMTGSDSEYNSQLNVGGMNLVWNFPDATGKMTVQGLGGHLVAPQAHVDFMSGNYEGGVIARKLSGAAQGHFYPMSMSLGESDDSQESTVTATATGTFSKKAVSAQGDELPGATLTLLYTGSGNLTNVKKQSGPAVSVSSNTIIWTSGNEPLVLEQLPDGIYTLAETGAPSGYKYATSIGFKVENGKIYQMQANGTYSSTSDTTLTMVDEAIAKTSVSVTKVWDDDNNAAGARPGSVEVQLYKQGKDDATPIKVGSAVQLSANNNWKYTWNNLDKTDQRGNTISYTIDEINVPDNYEKSVDGYTITNKYTGATQAVTATGTFSKKAVSKDGKELAGAKLTLTYTGNGSLANVTRQSGPNITTEGNKKITWYSIAIEPLVLSKLPDGNYILEETGAPSGYQYASAIEFKVENGNIYQKQSNGAYNTTSEPTITMVDEAIETMEVTVRKIWDDENDKAGVRPGTIRIQIMKEVNGEKAVEKWCVLKDGNNWSDTVTLDKTDQYGNEITYTVEESYVPDGYEESVNGFEITNTYTDNTEVTTATGTFSKQDAATGKELPGATLVLNYSGSGDLTQVTKQSGPDITQQTKSKIVWTSGTEQMVLDQLPNGEYILEETGAPEGYQYASAIRFKVEKGKIYQRQANGIYSTTENSNITMVDEAIGKTTVTVQKIWEDNNNADNVRPSAIKVQLFQKVEGNSYSTFVEEVELNAGNNWNYTWNDLPEINQKGKKITYIVDEAEVPSGYEKSVNEYTITNTYTDIAEITTATGTFSKKAATVDGEELPGATLSLTYTGNGDLTTVKRKDGPTLSEQTTDKIVWTSGNSPLILEQLPDGAYRLEETGAPEGYQYASAIEFKVENGKIYQKQSDGTYSTTENATIIMVDEAIGEEASSETQTTSNEQATTGTSETPTTSVATEGRGDLKIVVTDDKTGEPVPGATVTVTSSDGRTETYVTNSEGVVENRNIEAGQYTVKVTKVPEGYTVTTNTEFTSTVIANEKTEVTIRVTNSAKTTTEASDDESDDADSDDEDENEKDENTSGDSSSKTSTNSSNSAKTGDSTNVVMICILMFAAIGLFVVGLLYKKKR